MSNRLRLEGHVYQLTKRAKVSADLVVDEVAMLHHVRSSMAIRFTDPWCIALCQRLRAKGLLQPHPGSTGDLLTYQLTEAGTIALDAHTAT